MSIDEEFKLPDLGDEGPDAGVRPFSAEWKAAVQERVDTFVASLPLKSTSEDAEIEEQIAVRLYDAEIGIAAVRSRLSEWTKAAQELQATAKWQQVHIQRLQCQAATAHDAEEGLQELRHVLEKARAQAADTREAAETAGERLAEQSAAHERALAETREQAQRQQEAAEAALAAKYAAELERQAGAAAEAAARHVEALAAVEQRAAEAEQAAAKAKIVADAQAAGDVKVLQRQLQEADAWSQKARALLQEGEKRHADELSDLRAQLETARSELAAQQRKIAKSSGAEAAELADREAAAAAKHESELAALREAMRAEHAAEIAALEQEFAGITAEMQARADAAVQRERDSHAAQLQSLQSQLLTPARALGGKFDETEGSSSSDLRTPLGCRTAGQLVLTAPASGASERRDNPLYSPASTRSGAPATPPAFLPDCTPATQRRQAVPYPGSGCASGQPSTASEDGPNAGEADAMAGDRSVDSRRDTLEPCASAACREHTAQLQQRLQEATEALALAQEAAKENEAGLTEALQECQDMVAALQQFSHDQSRDMAAAQAQLQVQQGAAAASEAAAAEAQRLLAASQELIGSLREQLVQATARYHAAEAASDVATAARERAASEAAAEARSRCAALEASAEAAMATVQALSAELARKAADSGQGIGGRSTDALAAELAAEARRRVEAEAVVEELTQYNTAVVEQAQEQNEALLAQLHARECAIRDLMLRGGASAAEFAAFAADIDSRLLDTTTDYTVQPGDGLQHAAPDRNTFSSPQPSPRPASAAPAACGFGSGSTPGLRRPRPRALSATPLRDSVLQRLHFSASRNQLGDSAPARSALAADLHADGGPPAEVAEPQHESARKQSAEEAAGLLEAADMPQQPAAPDSGDTASKPQEAAHPAAQATHGVGRSPRKPLRHRDVENAPIHRSLQRSCDSPCTKQLRGTQKGSSAKAVPLQVLGPSASNAPHTSH